MMPQQRRVMHTTPADFNRTARLMRQKIGNIAYGENLSSQYLQLPNVGYHHRLAVQTDLTFTAAGTVTGRFLSGHNGGNTSRFPAPLGLVKNLKYALNVSSPIYSADGYGAHMLALVNTRGMNPWIQVATGDVGRAIKENYLFAIYNTTDAALVKPDAVTVASKVYDLRMALVANLTLGDAATAGLIPVQDIRINPQVFMDFGARADFLSVVGDAAAAPTGNFQVFLDYFTTPDPAIRPDTDFIKQTVYDQQQLSGTGEVTYRPQIGGVILRLVQSVWNNGKAINPFTGVDWGKLAVQQNVQLEYRDPWTFVADERRYYGKELPDELFVWDHSLGLGMPDLPSLRDRIATPKLTDLKYVLNINSGVSITGTAEVRNYREQLVPVTAIQSP